MIIHTWKIINGMVPNDINLEINDHKRLGTRLVLPKLSRDASRAALTAYDNSFAVRAVKLWNLLPKHVQVHGSLDEFKISLSGFLRRIEDKPPTKGYTTANHNSLLDWANQSGGLQKM